MQEIRQDLIIHETAGVLKVTIPKKIARKLGIGKGDFVTVIFKKRGEKHE